MRPREGFFGSLLDVSFSSLITTKVIKVIYEITLVILILIALALLLLVLLLLHSAILLVSMLIVLPLWLLCNVVVVRVLLEFIIVVFRIFETNQELVTLAEGGDPIPLIPPSQSSPSTPPTPSVTVADTGGDSQPKDSAARMNTARDEQDHASHDKSQLPPAGWYERPANPNEERYWNGKEWTDETRPTLP